MRQRRWLELIKDYE
jgi:hypothetical protein